MFQTSSSCLILVDLQEGFGDPHWGKRGNPALERNVAACLWAARSAGLPVIHVRHASREAGSPLREDRPGFAFYAFAKPAAGEEIFTKSAHGAFVETSLEAHLRGAGIVAPVFVGLAADHCVSTSVRMANDLGFAPLVVGDATAAFPRRAVDGGEIEADAIQRAALASLDGEFARVVTTKIFVETLRDES